MGNAARNGKESTARRAAPATHGLPLPNLDEPEPPRLKTSMIWRLKKRIIKKVRGIRNKEQESSRFSSTSDVSMVDSPFCCSPWNIPAILEEGNTRIYYCNLHKNAFAVEEGDFFMSRILSQVSAPEQFSGPLHGGDLAAGVPFGWEMHPGTPKEVAEDELIPPPSPPPAAQSLSLPRPVPAGRDMKTKSSAWKKAWLWIRWRGGKTKTLKMQHEISFRYNEKWGVDDDLSSSSSSSLRKISSVSSVGPLSRSGGWRVSKIRRNLAGRFGPWKRRELLVFARRKWNSLSS
ncbi:hypothetical protein SASPL_108973 [Salvia splendens]|uniref:Uncharacterized protein n=1 Tax=Salvia splendens TaxID=180675 RepID=A0A8X8YG98_SALSN|nr:uncharacterized protein LOC121795364 [Salvia splendens]KAG6430899.1 hypothetical protein SASPL_108973 [Salvia splendens]